MHDTHFDRIAEHYDESLPRHVADHYLRRRAAYVAEHVPLGSRLLDVGCGTGRLAKRLAAAGYDVTGADPSTGMIEVLERNAPEVKAVVASGESLPFDSGSFGASYCVAVMHHVAEEGAVSRTLSEMVRVVQPGGLVLVWDHNPLNPYWRRLMARVPQDTGEERLIGRRELIAGLERAGAEILAAERLGAVPDFVSPRALPAAARLERVVERLPGVRGLCAHNVILARRR